MKQQPIRTTKTISTHRCKVCGRLRKPGSVMNVAGVIDDDGKYRQIYRCVKCEGKGGHTVNYGYHGDRGVFQG